MLFNRIIFRYSFDCRQRLRRSTILQSCRNFSILHFGPVGEMIRDMLLIVILQLFCVGFSEVSCHDNSTSHHSNVNGRISVFWTGFEAEDSTARLFKLIGLLCVIALTTSLVCCCLCSFRKSRRRRKWVLVERVGFNDDEFLLPEQHDNHGMQMTDLREERKRLAF